MLLRYSLEQGAAADAIEDAVKMTITDGLRTGDIFTGGEGESKVNTAEMGAAIVERL
jgi:3-isopropylmalate dehydrogenase